MPPRRGSGASPASSRFSGFHRFVSFKVFHDMLKDVTPIPTAPRNRAPQALPGKGLSPRLS